MKKLLALLLCLALLPALPALAEDASLPLFRLVVTDEAGQETLIGSGMLYLDEIMLLTTASFEDQSRVKAYGPDGAAHEIQFAMESLYGLKVLIIEPGAGVDAAFMSVDSAAGGRLVGYTADGRRYEAPAIGLMQARFDNRDVYLASASEPLLPGAVLMGAKNELIGAVVASWGEGENRYVVLPGLELTGSLLEGMDEWPEEEEAAEAQWLTDVSFTWSEGVMTLDWTDSEMTDLNDDSVFTVYFEMEGNPFYSYDVLSADKTTKELLLVPDMDYNFWVRHTHGEAEVNVARPWDAMMSRRMPAEETLPASDFTEEVYLAVAPATGAVDVLRVLPPMAPITKGMILNPATVPYLQVINTYTVDEEIELSMLYTLRTPEGYTFSWNAGYIFAPEYQERDNWNADLSGLFEDYLNFNESGELASGEYELGYTIGGVPCGTFSFTLD